jgi:hypothetical protein
MAMSLLSRLETPMERHVTVCGRPENKPTVSFLDLTAVPSMKNVDALFKIERKVKTIKQSLYGNIVYRNYLVRHWSAHFVSPDSRSSFITEG